MVVSPGTSGFISDIYLKEIEWKPPSVTPELGGFTVRRMLWFAEDDILASKVALYGSLMETKEFVGWNGAYRFSVERERAMPANKELRRRSPYRCFSGD